MAKHYHVATGLGGGYTPNDVQTFESELGAMIYARELAEEWEDQEADSEEPRTPNGPDETGSFVFMRPEDPYDLGEYIEVSGPCDEPGCADDDS